jgi:hypothetical protein
MIPTPTQRRHYYQRVLKRLARYDANENSRTHREYPYICNHLEMLSGSWDVQQEFPELAAFRPIGAQRERPWWYDGKVTKRGHVTYPNKPDYASRIVAVQIMIEMTYDAER